MKSYKTPRLTVVGAGPGDPELITLKAIRALREADVVLYDALANPELLDYCLPTVERIFVGKRGHEPSISQDSINFMIVEKAFEKGHVVRLKGGDPFVFGRGNEEIQYAKHRGLLTSYVPGISSIQSPGFLDVPLTARGHAEGFWVLTGHKADGNLTRDLVLAAQSKSTVLILMGMRKLQLIQTIYEEQGQGNMPAMIVQSATTDQQKSVVGKAQDLVKMALDHGLSSPAIIILGHVIHAIDKQPLDQYFQDLYS